MPHSLRLAYLAHSLRSDWNNGNAHFLRGLMRSMVAMGHDVRIFEPCTAWSIEHLREEEQGERALRRFTELYPELRISTYTATQSTDSSFWRSALTDCDIVILHEWNPPALAHALLELRNKLGFCLLFHDTHHRASSSPEQIQLFGIDQFDGVVAFGEALRQIYENQFKIRRTWTLHEAADISIFRPHPYDRKLEDVVWIGNWGDDERAREIHEFLLKPAAALRDRSFVVYGVRYPEDGLAALRNAGVRYGGYLPNLNAPAEYGIARVSVHIPRQQYSSAMTGIPTIRVFEALACGIPLICSPWCDTEHLFEPGDFLIVKNGEEMKHAIEKLLRDKAAADAQALQGLETILSRHTCAHRAEELTYICEELLH
ncbi:MAG: glycosyltransferase [Candidatus Sulfotelmatobacter sp.]